MRHKIILTEEQESEIKILCNPTTGFHRIKSVELIINEVFVNVPYNGLFIITIDSGDDLIMDGVISIPKDDIRYEFLMNWIIPKIREHKLEEIGI